jgi:hypothetical protein
MSLLERHAMPGSQPTSGDYLFVILCVGLVVVAAALPLLAVWLGYTWLKCSVLGAPC